MYDKLFDQLERLPQDIVDQLNADKLEVALVPLPFPAGFSFTKGSGGDWSEVEAAYRYKHEAAIKDMTMALSSYLDRMMGASWAWADGPRNIIDTGELLASKSVTAETGGFKVSYNADYAGIIHYGGYITPYGNQYAAKVYIPGRPWILATVGEVPGPLPAFDWENVYMQYFNAA